jgi:hypothetical protein
MRDDLDDEALGWAPESHPAADTDALGQAPTNTLPLTLSTAVETHTHAKRTPEQD